MKRIDSRDNPRVKLLCSLLRDRKTRESSGLFVCEGQVMLEEALRSGAEVREAYCVDRMSCCIPAELEDRAFAVSESVMEKISGATTPQGLVFTCRIPEAKTISGRKLIALEDVRDPGNVGTVLRTADAFGMDGVAVLGKNADIYSPKTVRSSMGSVFRMPVFFETADSLAAYCSGSGLPLYAAALDADSLPVNGIGLKEGCVIIGNEAHGVSASAAEKCSGKLIIPIQGAESLNAAVAAAVIMWEMVR